MAYVFQKVSDSKLFWDGKVKYDSPPTVRWSYGYRSHSKSQRKMIEAIKNDWQPVFAPELVEISDLKKAQKLLFHYNLMRVRGYHKMPKIVIRRIEHRPVIKEAVSGMSDAQIIEADRLRLAHGSTIAESYARLDLTGVDPHFTVVAKRKGKSIETIRDLERGHSHGSYTFFHTPEQLMHARLVLGDKIDRTYNLR